MCSATKTIEIRFSDCGRSSALILGTCSGTALNPTLWIWIQEESVDIINIQLTL